MAEVDNSLLFEILKKLQTDMAKGFADVNVRLDRLEERMAHLERRQTASTHFEQSVLAHLATIHDSIDSLRAQLVGIERRVAVVEAR